MQFSRLQSLTLKTLPEKGMFRGYASTYALDQVNDLIEKGAFQKTLSFWRNKKKRFPYLYWQHDPTEPIGICQNLEEDDRGLLIEGKLLFDLEKAKEAYALMKKGTKGLSIGFHVTKSSVQNGIRKISELSLEEVSFVHTPCNQEATIRELKTLDEEKAEEEALLMKKIRHLTYLFRPF